MHKVMITAALTGPHNTKEANPNLPEQPEEIIEQAQQCREAGAAIVHIHARDRMGKSTLESNVFREIYDGIKATTDLIVEFSTGGPELPIVEKLAPMSLKPDMATLNTFLLVRQSSGKEVPVFYTRSDMEATASYAKEMKVKPHLVIMNLSCIEEVENLIEKQLLEKPYCFTIVLGITAQGALKATPKNLMTLVERLPEDPVFTVGAYGTEQVPLTTMSMILGGNVRVGLEDNIYYAPGRLAKSNAELVARAVRIAKELNLEVATPEEAREILKIK